MSSSHHTQAVPLTAMEFTLLFPTHFFLFPVLFALSGVHLLNQAVVMHTHVSCGKFKKERNARNLYNGHRV